ncbi:trichohyalin isoform X3 [Agrilus planipennis]|uniref:Trichohyalin isoform X3 n=1 Tax=Agrilus planipennis TaxID=224129 RepID=A0A7F5RDR3_AGRPL|nr:trichohyalin isoform X3 [Agrilus planipennis]
MMRCAVFGCHSDNQSKRFKKDIMFFSFPSDKKISDIWKNLCHRSDNFNVKTSRICSKHFVQSDYNLKHLLVLFNDKSNKFRRLKPDSIPSQFLTTSVVTSSSRSRRKRQRIKANREIFQDVINTFPTVQRVVTITNVFGNLEKIDQIKAWKRVLKIKNVSSCTRVCSLHFKKDDYIFPDVAVKRRKLKRNAVPSNNLPNVKIDNSRETRKINRRKKIEELIEKQEKDLVSEELDHNSSNGENLWNVQAEVAPLTPSMLDVEVVNDKKKERQQRYREQNREKLKEREAEKRTLKQNLQIITESSTNINIIELNNEKTTGANSQSLSGLEGIQASSLQENEQTVEKEAIQKRREHHQRHREQNREELKQHETEKRQCQQNSEKISEAIIDDPLIESPNQIEICKPKTAAERMKAYRARKKAEMGSYCKQIEIYKPKTFVECMKAYGTCKKAEEESCHNQIEICKPKTTAERSRAYRIRKKAEKESYCKQTEICKPKTAAYGTCNKFEEEGYHKQIEICKPKTATERSRAYRILKKTEKESYCKQTEICKPKSAVERMKAYGTCNKFEEESCSYHKQIGKRKPKTAAERNRAYRIRKKAEKERYCKQTEICKTTTAVERMKAYGTCNKFEEESYHKQIEKRKPKTAAERSRAYRIRKKAEKERYCKQTEICKTTTAVERMKAYGTCNKFEEESYHKQIGKRKPKTAAERNRAYRIRKKAEKERNCKQTEICKSKTATYGTCNKFEENGYHKQIEICKPKTAAERSRAYRIRKKAEKECYCKQTEICKPKTAVERMNAHGTCEIFEEEGYHQQIEICKPKTGAEHLRVYRNRKKAEKERTDNRVEVENYGISIKMEDDSEYDYYGHTEIKEEKWNIENIVKKESDSFLNGQDFEDDYSGSMKVEVKEEPSPTTSDLESEENNDQNSISGAIKTEHPIDDLQSPACSLQAKLPSSLTNCQLPANSALLLIPTVQGTASTVTLLNLNTLSPVNLSSILPNPLPPLVLNAKPGGNQLSVPTGQPFQNKE